MLGRLIGWSIRNRVLVTAAAGLVLVAGTLIALRIPVDVFPDLSAPTVTVLTDAHGMGPEEIEALVTFPIETALNGATGIRRVRSIDGPGIQHRLGGFRTGAPMSSGPARSWPRSSSPSARPCPPGVTPPILAPVSSIMGEIQLIAVRGEGSASPMDARTFADWVVRPRLLAVPGVSQVIPLGGEVRQYQVLVDPARLAAYGVSLDEVLDAARGSSANASGGIFMDAGQEYLVRGTGRVRREDDIARTAVAVRGGTPVLIGDVAEVVIGPAPPIGRGSVNAGPAVILSIQRQPEANTLELTGRIDATLDEIEADLPAGLRDRPGRLPAGHIHRDRGRQCPRGAPGQRGARRPRRLPLPLEPPRDAHLRPRDPALARRSGLRPRGGGDHDQHDDARRDGHRDRRPWWTTR